MKVSIVDHVGGHGGMDYYDYGLAYGLGVNKVFVNFHTCNETKIRDFDNVDTHHTFGDLWKKIRIIRIILFFKGYLKSFLLAKKNKVQVVHLHFFDFTFRNLILMFFSKFYSFKTIVTIHDVISFFNMSNKISEYYILKLADGIIVHNQTSFNDLKSKHSNLSKVSIIPHGNYLPFINKIEKPKIISQNLKILFFGQIKEVKGLEILLEALKISVSTNRKIQLTIAGKPNKTNFKKYNELIEELFLEDNVTTNLRHIDDSEIESFYKNSDLIVLPYKMISQSGVLLLSMSYGLPVLTSDLPAFTEIISDNKTGFIFESENSESLADKLIEIYDNRNLLPKVTQNSNVLIQEKYDWRLIGKKTKEFYQHILNE
jgi:glycosyltransferase involved in cell wall biosynthesis